MFSLLSRAHNHTQSASDAAESQAHTDAHNGDSDAETRPTQAARRWKFDWLSLVPALIMFIGFTSICYPPAMQYLNRIVESRVVHGYSRAVDLAKPDKDIQLRNAHIYNESLQVGAIYEPNSNIPHAYRSKEFKKGLPTPLDYDHQLVAGKDGLMAQLTIPKLNLSLPIYHGTSDDTLLKGLGHLRGTSLPVGGKGTRAVIAGHRGLAEAEMFTNLDKIHNGDVFSINVFGETLVYKVIETIVVNPDQTKSIQAERGRDLVTLVTCTPLGVNSQRILVTGERITPVPAEVNQTVQKKITVGFPWFVLLYIAGLALIGYYIYWAGIPVAARRAKSYRDLAGKHIAGDYRNLTE